MKKLAIDTSNQTLAVAVTDDGTLIGQIQTTVNKNHSTTLMPAIDFLMNSIQLTPKDLDQIVVAQGPGSYTGLRIGVTTAKTLAATLSLPLVGVSSLKIVAANIRDSHRVIVPLFNARRNNVYAGVYRWQGETLCTLLPDQHIAITDLVSLLKDFSNIQFVGQDVLSFADILQEQIPQASVIQDPLWCHPNAVRLAELAEQEEIVNPNTFVPTYLKRVEAEEKWLETHQIGDGNYVEKI